jgi:hypothetical protein
VPCSRWSISSAHEVTLAAIITATSALVTAIAGATLAILRELRVGRAATKRETESIHTIVNQQRTDMMAEIAALQRMIRRDGGDPDEAV